MKIKLLGEAEPIDQEDVLGNEGKEMVAGLNKTIMWAFVIGAVVVWWMRKK